MSLHDNDDLESKKFEPRGHIPVHMRLLSVILAALLLSGHPNVHADDAKDHDMARQALESGQIMPLRTIIEKVENTYSGQILEIELERKSNQWIYEIKMLRNDGLRIKLKVNAADGTVISDRRK
ncbi:MAG TPA: hypothetical protein DDY24_05655 [Alcaligenaceae bacterium]|nr:hypothetical protein [Alcaligenaceae bacterium]